MGSRMSTRALLILASSVSRSSRQAAPDYGVRLRLAEHLEHFSDVIRIGTALLRKLVLEVIIAVREAKPPCPIW